MVNLEDKCKWKEYVEEKKRDNPKYYAIGTPFFNCVCNCDGYETSKGCYNKKEINKDDL